MSSEGVPQLALVNGLCTAVAAYTPTMADQAIMVKKISNIYLGGPPLVKAALGEVISGKVFQSLKKLYILNKAEQTDQCILI